MSTNRYHWKKITNYGAKYAIICTETNAYISLCFAESDAQALCKALNNTIPSIKPTWESAPKWANYLVMDQDGSWAWHQQKPELGTVSWYISEPSAGAIERATVPGWATSLETRPNET